MTPKPGKQAIAAFRVFVKHRLDGEWYFWAHTTYTEKQERPWATFLSYANQTAQQWSKIGATVEFSFDKTKTMFIPPGNIAGIEISVGRCDVCEDNVEESVSSA